MLSSVVIGILLIAVAVLFVKVQDLSKAKNTALNTRVDNSKLRDEMKDLQVKVLDLQDELGAEREKNRKILSQKKSSETRLGQIGEHLVPFLAGCPYNPKDLTFLGNPCDFICFDFDQGEITFIEVKTGNSKASKRQKIIKNVIKEGRVNYAELRINEKGVSHKTTKNDK